MTRMSFQHRNEQVLPEAHREALKAFGDEVAQVRMRGWYNADWVRIVSAVRAAREAGVPWEYLALPNVETRGSNYDKNDPLRLVAVVWGPTGRNGEKESLNHCLAFALILNAKAARDLIKMGAPSVFSQLGRPARDGGVFPTPLASSLDVATWAFQLMRADRRIHHDYSNYDVGSTVLSALAVAAGMENKKEHAQAVARAALDIARDKLAGLWLNKAGCTPAEAEPAKAALWAQQVAKALVPLESIDPQWAADAAKIEAKAKAAGSGKAAQAARAAEMVPPEQRARWGMAMSALRLRDLPAWSVLSPLCGLDAELGLNSPLGNEERNHRGNTWLGQAVQGGAWQIAAKMLNEGANPWLLGPDALSQTDPARKSPLMGLSAFASSREAEGGVELGEAMGAAMLRDAIKVEPSEEAARALVRQELELRMDQLKVHRGIAAGLEGWSIRVALGLAGAQASAVAAESAPAPAEPAAKRVSRRI
jgi:hypothetical protein